MGIKRGRLYVNLPACPAHVATTQLDRLCDDIDRIYRHVGMVVSTGIVYRGAAR